MKDSPGMYSDAMGLVATWTERDVRLAVDGRDIIVRKGVKMPVFGLS